MKIEINTKIILKLRLEFLSVAATLSDKLSNAEKLSRPREFSSRPFANQNRSKKYLMQKSFTLFVLVSLFSRGSK